MKKIFTILFLLLSTHSYADELRTFNDIYTSLINGKNIKLVIYAYACSPTPITRDMIIYTTPQAVILHQNYLQFSNSPMTTNNPDKPDQPVLENVTYKINDKDQVLIELKIISLPDYQILKKQSSVCALNTAASVFN